MNAAVVKLNCLFLSSNSVSLFFEGTKTLSQAWTSVHLQVSWNNSITIYFENTWWNWIHRNKSKQAISVVKIMPWMNRRLIEKQLSKTEHFCIKEITPEVYNVKL